MSATLELRPGDTLNLVVDIERTTLLGHKVITQVNESLTYEQILSSFQRSETPTKQQRNWTVPKEAWAFNRGVAYARHALATGKAFSGKPVDLKEASAKFIEHLKGFKDELLPFVSEKSRESLVAMTAHKDLKAEQKKEIKDFLAKFKPTP